MRSLKSNLIRSAVLGTTLILIVAGLSLYLLVENSLVSQFDNALQVEALLFASTTEGSGDRIETDFSEFDLKEFKRPNASAYLQLWLDDGTVLYRSESLEGRDLNRGTVTPDTPVYWWETPSDNAPLRVVGIHSIPRLDDETEIDEIESGSVSGITLVLARDASALISSLSTIRILLLALGFLTIAVTAAVLLVSVGRGLRPVNELSDEISLLDEHSLSKRIEIENTTVELQPVITRLNQLLRQLETAFERERQFSADLAHELRTPLSGLRAKAEVALSRKRDPAEYERALNESLNITLQLQKMAEALLSLTRIESDQIEINNEPVMLDDLIRHHWRAFEDRAAARQLDVHWQLARDLQLVTDISLLAMAVENVLENAVEHAEMGGVVRIETGKTDDKIFIRIANSGCDIPENRADQVFNRFWQKDAARSMTGRHFGLGLPLVKKIVQRLGGEVFANTELGGEFTITIYLMTA